MTGRSYSGCFTRSRNPASLLRIEYAMLSPSVRSGKEKGKTEKREKTEERKEAQTAKTAETEKGEKT